VAAEQRTERRQRRKRKGIFFQGSVCKTEETQGLYGKLTFPIDTEI
jgi:hypothetical protein